jgi:Ca-activated chloride channel homolog
MISSSGNKGFYFKEFEAKSIPPFEMLFDIFKELITHTSGDFDEAIAWLRELDKEYQLTDENYTIDDFIGHYRQNRTRHPTNGTRKHLWESA